MMNSFAVESKWVRSISEADPLVVPKLTVLPWAEMAGG